MDLFAELKRVAVLLIDDDEWVRDSLSIFFESEGCSIVALETAEAGLTALKKHNYGVIIADYRLPGMNGLQFLESVNQMAVSPQPIKILITAYGSDRVLREVERLGIDDFIAKPFSTSTLLESLRKQMENFRHNQQRGAITVEKWDSV